MPVPGERRQWGNVPGCGAALTIAEIAACHPAPLFVIAGSVAQAEALESQLRFFLDDASRLALFPDLEILPYDSFSPHQDLVSSRLRILRDLRADALRILVTAIPTLLPRLAPVEHLQRNAVRIARGETLSLGAFQATSARAVARGESFSVWVLANGTNVPRLGVVAP